MVIDLRSDTVTVPDQRMLDVMRSAEVGDDVYGEDPTVNRLQEAAAEISGKAAALFVSSGTMGNLIGILVSAGRGQEVICDSLSHVFSFEAAGAAVVGGIQLRPIDTPRGVMNPAQVLDAVRDRRDPHQPVTAAVSIENTHNQHGGVAWTEAEMAAVAAAAHSAGLRVHLDGARIFNAALAVGCSVADLTRHADTIQFCLSKGLAAPVGSVICGSEEDIAQARRWRKMLGGGMRQAGSLAAAGLLALEELVDRLAEDHANARLLAEGLAAIDGIAIDLSRVQTNIVRFELEGISGAEFRAECRRQGLLGGGAGHRMRFVTHRGIDATDIRRALEIVSGVMRSAARGSTPRSSLATPS